MKMKDKTREQSKEYIDIQIILRNPIQMQSFSGLLEKLRKINKSARKVYHLSDGTTIIPAVIPLSALDDIESEESVRRIEKTRYLTLS